MGLKMFDRFGFFIETFWNCWEASEINSVFYHLYDRFAIKLKRGLNLSELIRNLPNNVPEYVAVFKNYKYPLILKFT